MSEAIKPVEKVTKLGRPSRKLTNTDICVLIRHLKMHSYDFREAHHYDETDLFEYIMDNDFCTGVSSSKEETEKQIAYYTNATEVLKLSEEDLAKRIAQIRNHLLTDEETFTKIRQLVSELGEETWSRILSRKRQAEHRKKASKKKISVSSDVFHELRRIKSYYFNNAPWDEVLLKLSNVVTEIQDLKDFIEHRAGEDSKENDDMKLLIQRVNSLLD